MGEEQSNSDRGGRGERIGALIGRRGFIAAGGSATAALLAGCTAENPSAGGADDASMDGDETTEPTDDGASTGGNFRLLISDLPADIGDFERLDVSFGSARIFDGGDGGPPGDDGDDDYGETDDDGEGEKADDDGGKADDDQGEQTDEEDDDEEEIDDKEDDDHEDETANRADGVERRRGFYVLDLDGATVDLTEVIGEKAMSVFEGNLSEGSYDKIELHVSDIEGIVDGEEAEVQVPSEKLQITHPFEIRAGGAVDFVFDINVVRRGQGNRYNLTPVISQSGVNGETVDVEVLDEERSVDDEEESVDGETDGEDDEDETDESAAGDDDHESDGDNPESDDDDQKSGDKDVDADDTDDEDDADDTAGG